MGFLPMDHDDDDTRKQSVKDPNHVTALRQRWTVSPPPLVSPLLNLRLLNLATSISNF